MRFARLKLRACHAKWRWRSPKCWTYQEKCNSYCENLVKVLRLSDKNAFRHFCRHVRMSGSARPAKQNDFRTRFETVGASNLGFRARLSQNFTLCSYKIDVFLGVFPQNSLPQNRCFVRGFRQYSSPVTKCHAYHIIGTLSPLDAALTMRFAKARNTTCLMCCAWHEKWRWRSPKCCACQENPCHLLKMTQNVLRLSHKATLDTL